MLTRTFESSDVLRAVIPVRDLLATCFHSGFLLCLLLDPEDGGDMFIRNVYVSLRYVMYNV
jgi:hypothetical protein